MTGGFEARSARTSTTGRADTVAVVVVTYNRADLLGRMLDGLAAQSRRPDAVYIVDNASTDHTREVLGRWHGGDLPLEVTHNDDNLGGAGGFHLGLRRAYADGFDRIWLMDDDVVPAPDCLAVLMARDEECLMAVREDTAGRLVEKAALRSTSGTRWPSSRRPRWSRPATAPARRCRSGSRSRTSRSRGSWFTAR